MTTLTDNSKAAIVLTTRLGDSNRPSLTAIQWHRLIEDFEADGKEPSTVFTKPPDDVRLTELVADSARVMFDLESIIQRGIWVVTEFDENYPERYRRLGPAAPPVLFGAGNKSLLNEGGIGAVGSRDVDEAGAEVAQEIAREAVRLGLPVISGGARGVDSLAMNAAFSKGGHVVGVLADSLERSIRSSSMLSALDEGAVALMTQQHPRSGFSPQAAYGRNKLIYALADATVVVASAKGSGGTWKGAKEALSKGLAVLVWRGAGEGPGNETLERSGALPLRAVEDIELVLRQIDVASENRPQDPEQLRIIQ